MAQLDTSVIFYSQAVKQIQDLRDKYQYGIVDVDNFVTDMTEILSRFENSVGIPLTKYDPVVETEPPLSNKYNAFLKGIESDVNILQYQFDVLRSSAVSVHNLIVTEIEQAKSENIRVSNKAKTLQLYSDAVDSSIITFGDYFQGEEFLDNDLVPLENRAMIPSPGYLTLGQTGDVNDLSASASVRILSDSNGFLGNLHEVSTDTVTTQLSAAEAQENKDAPDSQFVFVQQPVFKAETNARNNVGDLLDGEPNTWFEYESCLVSATDRALAKSFDFSYEQLNTVTNKIEQVDWAKGPTDGALKLGLEFDLKSVNTINYISLLPFNLEDNSNFAIHISEVRTSKNGTDWDIVKPSELFVGTTPNIHLAVGASNIYSAAVWSFAGRQARYVRIFIDQKNPINRRLGHIYYVDKNGKRTAGPIPPIENPTKYYDPNQYTNGDLVQKRETFNAKRWVIGLRDVSITNVAYSDTSYTITKLLRIGSIVDRVSLEADIDIPEEFPSDNVWVEFHVSPNNGEDWFQISRIQDDFQDIPEILAFNDPIAEQFRENGVGYCDVDGVVKELRLKIVLSRPSTATSSTPIVRSFKLKVKTR